MKHLKTFFAFMLMVVLSIGQMWGTSATWALVTSEPSDWSGEYLIVYSSNCFDGSLTSGFNGNAGQSVSISNNKITKDDQYSLTVSKVSNKYYLQTASGYYIGRKANSNGVDASGTSSADYVVTFSNWNGTNKTVKIAGTGGRCLGNNSGSWKFFASSNTYVNVSLYKKISLSSIAVKSAPTKVSYTEGDFFAPAGLVITKTFSDNSTEDVTYNNTTKGDFTFSPTLTTALTTSHTSVTITYGGKSTNQAITVTASGCTNNITVVKGSESHGTFTLSKSGSQATCNGLSVLVTPSAADHYHVGSVSATTGETGTDNGDGTWTITYAANATGSSTINVVFAEDNKYTLNYHDGNGDASKTNVYEGTNLVTALGTPAVSCDATSTTFVSWTTTEITKKTNTAPTFVASDAIVNSTTAANTYYAVYAKKGSLTSVAGGDIASGFGETGLSGSHSDFYTGNGFKFKAANNYVTTGDISSNNYKDVTVKLKAGHNGGSGSVLTIASFDKDGNTIDSETFTPTEAYTSQSTTYTFELSGSKVIKEVRVTMTSKTNNLGMKYCEVFYTPLSDYMTTCCTELDQINESVSLDQTTATLTWNAIDGVSAWSVSGNVKNGAAIAEANIGTITSINDGAQKKCIISNLASSTTYEFKINATTIASGYCTDVNEWALEGTTEANYTITEATNNSSYGTVTRSGNVITGSPKENCRYATPAYTVDPENSATVSQNGNAFTVTPSANTTVTINFEAIPTHKVTFSANGNETKVDVYEDAAIEFPTTATGCAGKTFRGWSASEVEETNDENDFSYVTSANMGSTNVTYYAVFATKEGEDGYEEITSNKLSTLASGDKIVLTGVNNGSYAGMKAYDGTSNNCKSAAISVSSGNITSLGDACELTLGGSSSAWTFFDGTYYIYAAGSAKNGGGYNNYMKGKATSDDDCKWSITIDNGTTKVTSSKNTATPHMQYNSSNSLFSCYNTESQNSVTLYRKTLAQYSGFTTSCTPQAATPTIIGVANKGDYNEMKSITITTSTSGATIYYTLDGTTPSSNSTQYTAPFTPTNGGDLKLRAIAIKSGMDDSEIASADFTLPFANIADFIENGSTTVAKKLLLTDAIVLGKTSSNIYVQDATGGIILYNSTAANVPSWASGKKISGYVIGKKTTYNDMPEVTACDFSNASATVDGVLPTAKTITETSNTDLCTLVKMEGVKFQATSLTNGAVNITKGDNTYVVYNTFSVLNQTLPNSATDCDVVGVLGKNNNTFRISPISVDGISTNGAKAILPTLSTTGGVDEDHAVAVAEGKVITITPAAGMTSTYKDGTADVEDLTNTTNVTVDADKAIVVTATAYYYTENSATYYYHADASLTERAISKATMTNGGVIVKIGNDVVSSAAQGATIRLLPNPANNYHLLSIDVTDEDNSDVVLTEETEGEEYTFIMPAKAVTVSATFEEDAYATVAFAKGNASATGNPPSSFKKYVGQTATMPGKNNLALNGNSFVGWSYGGNNYAEGATYTILASDAAIGGKTITFEAQWTPYPWGGNGKWELVTSASEITVSPATYIIFADTQESGNKACGETQNTNNRATVDVSIDDGILTWSGESPAVFTVETGYSENTFAFYDAVNDGYIYAAGTGTNNYLKTKSTKNANDAAWAIESIDGETGEASVRAQSNNRNLLQVNGNVCAAYSGKQKGLAIYKFVAGSFYNINYAKGVAQAEEKNVTNMPEPQVTANGGTATLSDKEPIYVGYTFNGWKDQDNNEYQPGDNVTLTKNVTLTAQWTAASKYTLSYDKNGGEGTIPAATDYYPNAEVTLAGALEKEGLLFAGWEYDGNVYAAGDKFTMPAEDVLFVAKYVSGAVYTLPTNKDETTTVVGTPEGASFNFTSTGGYSYSQVQLTGSKELTLTLSGYDYYTITGLVLNMRTNNSGGKGSLSVKIGGTNISFTTNKWYDGSHHSSSNEDIHVSLTPTRVLANQDIVITISSLENSLYCKSITVEYEVVRDEILEVVPGTIGTYCPKKTVKFPAGATFFAMAYVKMVNDVPYKVYFDELAEDESLIAGHPYFYIADDDVIMGIKVGDAATAGINDKGLIGKVDEYLFQVSESEGNQNSIFVVYQNSIKRCGDGWFRLGAEKAYIDLRANGLITNEENAPQPAPGRRRASISNAEAPQVATGLDALSDDSKTMKVIIDNQLFIIRNGKIYDTTGRLVENY